MTGIWAFGTVDNGEENETKINVTIFIRNIILLFS